MKIARHNFLPVCEDFTLSRAKQVDEMILPGRLIKVWQA